MIASASAPDELDNWQEVEGQNYSASNSTKEKLVGNRNDLVRQTGTYLHPSRFFLGGNYHIPQCHQSLFVVVEYKMDSGSSNNLSLSIPCGSSLYPKNRLL